MSGVNEEYVGGNEELGFTKSELDEKLKGIEQFREAEKRFRSQQKTEEERNQHSSNLGKAEVTITITFDATPGKPVCQYSTTSISPLTIFPLNQKLEVFKDVKPHLESPNPISLAKLVGALSGIQKALSSILMTNLDSVKQIPSILQAMKDGLDHEAVHAEGELVIVDKNGAGHVINPYAHTATVVDRIVDELLKTVEKGEKTEPFDINDSGSTN